MICLQAVAETRIAGPSLVDAFAAFASHALPLLRWGWAALADER